jgi:hypothetical protein
MNITDGRLTIGAGGGISIIYEVQSGMLRRGYSADSMQDILDEKFYNNRSVALEFLNADGSIISGDITDCVILRITLFYNNSQVIRREYAVNPIGLT